MSYKRLRSHIKTSKKGDADQLLNAFEAEGKALQNQFSPAINQPHSNYQQEIELIRKVDPKLGITFERLNQHQRHAVFNPAHSTMLSAMVGSGKTTVLIAKIFHLHFIKKIPFSEMIVLTFTNKAAREIKERIASFLAQLDEELNHQLRFFGTFHAVARQILQEHPHIAEIGFKPNFMIMDEQEKHEFLDRLIAQNNLNIKYQNKLTKRWQKFHKSGETMMGNMKSNDDFEQLVLLAEQEKRIINTMDFNDLITLCNKLLENRNHTAPKWIIVDEFQDCNAEQLMLIENLKTDTTNLFVVGDQNQSIYGWRGSNENLFQEIQAKWQATWMELPHNYRSSGNIISVAETLLQQNGGNLIPTRQSGTLIALVRHFDDQQEAYYLREQLLSAQSKNESLDQIAILFRTHQQIKIVETVLAQTNIPHQLVKRNALHENPAQSLLLQILKISINHNDIDACLALMCNKVFGCLKRHQTLIQTRQERHNRVSALQATRCYLETKKHQHSGHLQLLKQIEKFKLEFSPTPENSSQNLIDFLTLQPILKPTSIHHKEYLYNISEAWDQLRLFMRNSGNKNSNSSFHVAIDQVVLEGSFHINDRIKEQGHGVHLLTIHASKGLEFDRVYIAGANTGIIPLAQHQKESQNLKEEKRLLFVAITRAKNTIEIGWHAQPSTHNTEPEPSYFLNVIPDSLINRKISADEPTNIENTASLNEWQTNMAIKHKKYGKGKITEITNKELICSFETSGERSFSKAFAKALLEKIE